MARSYSQGFRPRNDQPRDFGGPVITGGAGFTSSLGDTVNLGNSYAALRKSAIRNDELAATSIANRAAERATATQLEAQAHATGLSTMADVKSNKLIAEAQKDAAQSQASGSMMGSALGAIGSIGGALIGLSDESTKHTVERIEDALAVLRDLKPVTFYYKEEYSMSPERMHHGFIAQDYAKVMPDATYYDEELGKMCIDTSELIGLLVRSVQQLETRIARMEAANALMGVK
jgi:hypothetical protein